jgi:hypothetical protein
VFTLLARRKFFVPELTTPAAAGTRPGCRALDVQDSIGLRPGWLDPAVREIKIFFSDPV